MNTAKKWYGVLACLVLLSIVFGILTYAEAARSVAGTYQVRFQTKVWLQGEGTDTNTTYGTCYIRKNKTWKLTEEWRKYSGEWRYSGNYIRVRQLKSLRSRIEKQTLKPWLKNYIRNEYGDSVTGIKFSYSTYKISKIKIYSYRLGSFKIIVKGKVSGYVDGQYHVRAFKYQSKVTFL